MQVANVAMAWTGGKDSSLALYEAEKLGYEVQCLVTFAWSEDTFLAHPLKFMALQAEALGLPHYTLNVREPFERGYEEALSSLKREYGIEIVATGDIAEVAGHNPNWLDERAAHAKIDLIRPLWHNSRIELLNRLLELGFKVVISCVNRRWLTDEWLGVELSPDAIQRLVEVHERTGLDLSGEQGEYHTLVIDGPQFKKKIRIESYSKQGNDSIMYIRLEKLRLEEKQAA
jgi:uncharacterized protein (TIGR00290 family)